MGETKEKEKEKKKGGKAAAEAAEEAKEESRISLTLGGEEAKDETCATFLIKGEDHTIGNALKEIVSRYPETEMCGYNMPYPTEPEMLFRIQSRAGTPARDLLRRGLHDLQQLFLGFRDKFADAHAAFRAQQPQAMDDE